MLTNLHAVSRTLRSEGKYASACAAARGWSRPLGEARLGEARLGAPVSEVRWGRRWAGVGLGVVR